MNKIKSYAEGLKYKPMKVIYTAGPYTDHRGSFFIWKNISRAAEEAHWLLCNGYAVICPHLNTQYLDSNNENGATPRKILQQDLELIKRCDGILLLRGWEYSHGVREEIKFCMKNNIPIYLDRRYLKDGIMARITPLNHKQKIFHLKNITTGIITVINNYKIVLIQQNDKKQKTKTKR
ncbi:MAG: DUF4406 domain-containing protein [bacterium]|nr:DUF4406 domain-containing protein [bacterium]